MTGDMKLVQKKHATTCMATTQIFNPGIDPENGKYNLTWDKYRYSSAGPRLGKVKH